MSRLLHLAALLCAMPLALRAQAVATPPPGVPLPVPPSLPSVIAPSIAVRAGNGGRMQVAPGAKFAVPIVADMSAASPNNLATAVAALAWNAARLTLDSIRTAGFGTLTTNTTGAPGGNASVTVQSPSATVSSVTLATMYFTASATPGGTTIAPAPSLALNSAATSVLNIVRALNLDVCVALSVAWGDVNADATVNIIDAQQLARYAVGLTVSNPQAVSSVGDVNADAQVNIIDAQVIARFSVGLSASARVNTPALIPPTITSVAATPSSTTLTAGQTTSIVATPADGTATAQTGCVATTWTSSDPTVATVDNTGFVTAVAAGSATITATAGGVSGTATLTVNGALPAASLAIVSGDNQVQRYATAFVAPMTAQVRDAANNPVPGTTVTFSITSGSGSFVGSSTTSINAISDATGLASAMLIAISSVSTHTITASASGLTPITFHAKTAQDYPQYGRTPCQLSSTGAAYCWGNPYRGQVGNGVTNVFQSIPATVLGGLQFSSLASGVGDHVCALTLTGQAYCWGSNGFGELGDGTTTDRSTPVAVQGGLTFTQLAISVTSSCGLTAAGTMYCWGWASTSLFGDGVRGTVQTAPALVATGGITFTKISVAMEHACGVATSGAVYCWGLNSSGELGDNTTISRLMPTPVSAGLVFSSVSASGSHTCAVTTSNAAYCWGSNFSGQLGDGTFTQRNNPTPVIGGVAFASVDIGGSDLGWDASCGLSVSGQAYCWGNGFYGELGDGTASTHTSPSPVLGGITFTTLSRGSIITCGRGNLGQPYCWGWGANNTLGDNIVLQRNVPVPAKWVEGAVGQPASLIVDPSTNPYLEGGIAGANVLVPPSVLVRDFANTPVAGVAVTFAAASGGGSVVGGSAITNANGVATATSWLLGATSGTNTVVASVPSVPSAPNPVFTAFGATGTGSMAVSFGDNQVQSVGSYYISSLSVLVKDAASVGMPNVSVTFTITSGGGFFFNTQSASITALTAANGVASVPSLFTGPAAGPQIVSATATGLAPVTFTERIVPAPAKRTRCELTSAGLAYCWGRNDRGQIGDASLTQRNIPTAVGGALTFASLADGSADHACGLTVGGVAYCWGSNGYGELGDGTTLDRSAPVAVTGGLTFVSLFVGATTTCGITTVGALYCWGGASYGMFGDNAQATYRSAPVQVLTGGRVFTTVSIGALHICALTSAGAAFCWGYNGSYQLGDGTTATRLAPFAVAGGLTFASISAGDANTCAVTTAGAAYCWGYNLDGSVGDPASFGGYATTPTAVAGGLVFSSVSASGATTCGRTTASQVYCWGNNADGAVGDGTTTIRTSPTLALGGISFASVRVRGLTACGRATSSQPFCWGYGGDGGIGNNATASVSQPAPVQWVQGTAGAGVSIVVSAGNNQAGVVGNPLPTAPSVLVRDFANNPVSGVTVTFAVASGGGSVTGASAVSNASGIATVGSWTMGPALGTNTLTATIGGVGQVVFTATSGAAPSSVVISSGDNQVQQTSQTFVTPLSVLVKDVSNNPMANVPVAFVIATGSGTLTGGTTSATALSNANGIASVSLVATATTGAITVTATAQPLATLTFNARTATAAQSTSRARCDLTPAGAAYCWGINSRGQIADGTFTNRNIPTAVSGGLTFASLADGMGDHMCGLTSAGAAYCWGSNAFGELGDGTTTDRNAPVAVPGGLVFSQIAVSSYASCGVTTANVLYCWGWAGQGLYGDGIPGIIHTSPFAVTTGGPIFTRVSVGLQHACALTAANAAYCWGLGTSGQIGDNNTLTRTTPTLVAGGLTLTIISVGDASTCAVSAAGAGFCWGSNLSGRLGDNTSTNRSLPTAIAGGILFNSVTASGNTTCGKNTTGQAYCWGNNGNGQVGDASTTQRSSPAVVAGGITFTTIRASLFASCGRATTGQPYCWGFGGSGDIGDNTTTNAALAPTPVTWVIGSAGVPSSVVMTAGNNQFAIAGSSVLTAPAVLVRDYANIPVAGASVTFAVASGGGSITGANAITNSSGVATLGSWTLGAGAGVNTLSASASGTPTPVFTAIGTVAPSTMTLVSGDNQVEMGGFTYVTPISVLVKDASNNPLPNINVQFSVAGGVNFGGNPTLNVLTNASGVASATPTACCGLNTQSLVTASVPGVPNVTSTLQSAQQILGASPCELTSAGAAYCWGDNFVGQIGDGTTTQRNVPTAVGGGLTFASLATGTGLGHACALTSGGTAYCWGFNGLGQLGDGTNTDRTLPTPVSGGLTFSKLFTGAESTCGVTTGNVLYCWGWAGGGLYGDGVLGVMKKTPTAVVTGGLTFTNVAIGGTHVCGVATTGVVYCWGVGTQGQLGDGTFLSHTVPTAVNTGTLFSSLTAGAFYTCALSTTGSALCWGLNSNNQLGDGTTSSRTSPALVSGGLTFTAISASSAQSNTFTTCARATSGAAYCWGASANGQIGDGTLTQRSTPVPVSGGISFTSLRQFGSNTCGRASSGQPFCWGANITGQVGDNTTTQRLTPTPSTWVEGTGGTPASIVLNGGNAQTATHGTTVATAPSVLVRDYAGNPVSGVTVSFAVVSGGGAASGISAITNASGIATVGSWTLGAALGTNTLTATLSGVGQITFTATAN